MTRPAIFLDRDGVLNALVDDPVDHRPEAPTRLDLVTTIAPAHEAARELHEAGWTLVVVTNQPSAAKGKCTLDELHAIQEAVTRDLPLAQAKLCPHTAQDDCSCRKPRPGMLLEAARDLNIDLKSSWMVGDTDTDVQAGRAAGTRTALVLNPDSAHKRSGSEHADATASSLRQLVDSGVLHLP